MIPESQKSHIQLNAGNVFAIMLLSVVGTGAAMWTFDYLSHTNIPILSQLAIGGKYWLRTP
ncbi:MAG: hypothetical protein QXL94_02985 [Candidatus Parvarchaeum sp.]